MVDAGISLALETLHISFTRALTEEDVFFFLPSLCRSTLALLQTSLLG